MKKTLLLAAFAMAGMVSAQAFEVGDYVYTKTQRLKISGENLVQNGTFAEGFSAGGWCSAAADGIVNQGVWTVVDGIGPNGEAAVQSQAATADEALCNVWAGLEGGQTYVVSFDIKGESTGTTTVGTTVGANYADFFLNGDGSRAHAASTDEAPVVNVATAFDFTDEWTTVSYVLTPDQGQMLVMHFERLATGVAITNFSLHQADEVFDDRIARKKLAWADKLLADPNFNTDEAAGAKEEFMGVYAAVAEDLENGGETAGEYMDAFDELLGYYLDASSDNIATEEFFKYSSDLTTFPKYNRGQISNGQIIGGFVFRGDNWYHGSGSDQFNKYIGPGGKNHNGPGSVALYSTTLPAGKYYVSAEIRNAWAASNWGNVWTFDQADIIGFVGKDSTNFGTIKGEEWTKFYVVAELKEGETFEAGFYWNGPDVTNPSGVCYVRNFEARAFGNVVEEAHRVAAWNTFIAQWNAAKTNREALIALQADANYPWEKDSLARALAQWDPYYNALIAKGWISEDGEDTGVATNDELTDWATYQGVELYDETGELLKYQLVRGYQNAINYVKAQNKIFQDVADEIAAAEAIRDDDMNLTGDKQTFQTAIDAAQNLLDTTKKNTTDATREADEATMNTVLETLKAAEEAFKASVVPLTPIIDIDFSNGFEPVKTAVTEGDEPTTSSYVIKGTAGEMSFPLAAVSYNEETGTYANTGNTFGLGTGEGEALQFGDVLRVGNNTATVALNEVPGDEDVVRVQFNAWFGKLGGKYMFVELRNAAGERVAGFRYNRYDNAIGYNDFNNEGNTGMDIQKYTNNISNVNNADILTDKNKSSFDLIIDYKAKTMVGTITTTNGTCTGTPVALSTLADNKIATFAVGSDYNNEGRRCWFDDLVIYKYASQAAGPIDTGIATVDNAVKPATGAIYNLMGVRLNSKPAKGLYIMDGKKYMAK